jgi:hypothetical protein
MKRFIAALMLASTAAQASEYNHLKCTEVPAPGIKTKCIAESGAVSFEDAMPNPGYDYEMQFKVAVDFACPGNFQSEIQLLASEANGGPLLKFGQHIMTVSGTGPVRLSDLNSKLTDGLMLSDSCSLSFRLQEAKPSEGQVSSWNSQTLTRAAEMDEVSSIYQTRTTIMFWDKKVKSGDQKYRDMVTKLRDDTKILFDAQPTNRVLKSRLKKYNDMLEGVPTQTLEESYGEVLSSLKAVVADSEKLQNLMQHYELMTAETFKTSLANAKALTAGK